jgi:heme/copper-type cytochrome/quinol oxidase subunit 4
MVDCSSSGSGSSSSSSSSSNSNSSSLQVQLCCRAASHAWIQMQVFVHMKRLQQHRSNMPAVERIFLAAKISSRSS